jgi:osmotically inducible protein OsmC
MPAKGSAEWQGDVPSGTGTFTAGGTISLILAAHAACFSIALSNLLAQTGTQPESVHSDATVTLRPVDGEPTITKIALVTVGRVPGLDEPAFVEQAQAANSGCPVSRALAGVSEITLQASLAQ